MRYLIIFTVILTLAICPEAVATIVTQLTTDTGMMPHWSPDGDTIVYMASQDIWTIPVTGGTPTQVTTYSGVDGYGPKYSPDGSMILYSTTMSSSGLGIWSIPSGGGNPTKVYDSGANDFRASWSPDGSQIAYRSETPNQTLWVVDSNGTGSHRIQLTSTGGYSHPIWHPDGSTIVFHSLSSGPNLSDLWTIPSTGGAAANFTNTSDWNEIDPAYSPDGQWIAFVSDRDSKAGIWVMPAVGGEQTLIVDYDIEHVRGAAWSPDGTMIAFDVETPGAGYRDIYIASDLPIEPIPEPSTIILLTTGLVGVIVYGKAKVYKKRRS